jgi:hypothetical protein
MRWCSLDQTNNLGLSCDEARRSVAAASNPDRMKALVGWTPNRVAVGSSVLLPEPIFRLAAADSPFVD